MKAESAESSLTATSRALSTPEIIGSILEEVYNDCEWRRRRTLRACSLVNSSWEVEVRRFIWKQCGQQNSCSKSTTPGLRDLSATSVDRQKQIAQHIKTLVIGNQEVRVWQDGKRSVQGYWHGVYLPTLGYLAFPHVERIELYGPHIHEPGLYSPISLKQIIGPSLKSFKISGNHTLSSYVLLEEMIRALTVHAKRLRQLTFDYECESGPEIPTTLLDILFDSATSLESLKWDIVSSLSITAFKSLSRLPSLQSLELPETLGLWIGKFSPADFENCFGRLVTLRCHVGIKTLSQLLPFLQCLKDLRVQVTDEAPVQHSAITMKEIANSAPTTLELLEICVHPKAVIPVQDILRIAKSVQNLLVLRILTGSNHEPCMDRAPKLSGFNDKFVKEFAMSAPKLEGLALWSCETKTSEKSLIYLGRYCPDLILCTITLQMSFHRLFSILRKDNPNPISWPTLHFLMIRNFDPKHTGDETREDHAMSNIVKLWKRLDVAMPAIGRLQFESAQLTEFMIHDAFAGVSDGDSDDGGFVDFTETNSGEEDFEDWGDHDDELDAL